MAKRRKNNRRYDTLNPPGLVNSLFQFNTGIAEESGNEYMLLRVLTELALNRYEWVGLPDSVDGRFIEMTLLYQGLNVFYYDKDFNRYMALRAASYGPINMYNNPTSFTVIGNTMVHKTLSPKQCVPIWCNKMRIPDLDIIRIYARRLSELDRTIEIMIKNVRHTKVITCDESERMTFMNIIRMQDEGQPVIFGTSSLDLNKIGCIDLEVDENQLINLQISRNRMWNECMTLLGVNNANQDKNQVVLSDEVNANNEQVFVTRGSGLKERRIACERINEMFGLSIDVVYNPDSGL